MKKISVLFLALVLLLSACTGTEDLGGEVGETTDTSNSEGSVSDAEKENDASEEKDNDPSASEDNLYGYEKIPTVKVGALDSYDLIFEGVALKTPLPRSWTFEDAGTGRYTVFCDGSKIGEAVSGEVSLYGWSVVSEDLYETEDGVVINTFVDACDSEELYRRRIFYSLADAPWASATLYVSYEQLDQSTMYRIWRESALAAVQNAPSHDLLWDIEEGETVLILGNSFISSSKIGVILTEMCRTAPFAVSVEAVSRGYAQVGTYTGDSTKMQAIREGRYGCVFICGFYSEGEIENLKLLKDACDASETPLVIFPAHNENASVIAKAVGSDDALYYLPWRDEIDLLMSAREIDLWDMCVNDMHKHSTPLAGYVGAHMIYRALFGESPIIVSVPNVIEAETLIQTLGEAYLRTGTVCTEEKQLVFP